MSLLSNDLAKIIRSFVADAVARQSEVQHESRFIFYGPPNKYLTLVFEALVETGGIRCAGLDGGKEISIPILMVSPDSVSEDNSPAVGESGICDADHLLDLRNHLGESSFLALVPPGSHLSASIDSTTSKFGLSPKLGGSHVPFDQWWQDSFLQKIIESSIRTAGVDRPEAIEGALRLIEKASHALDSVSSSNLEHRDAIWSLISRLYSIKEDSCGLSVNDAVALVCGFPPCDDVDFSDKDQIAVLDALSSELAVGFKTGIEAISAPVKNDSIKKALKDFLSHIQERCEIPTAFERATSAFYLTNDSSNIVSPPMWWHTLSVRCWSDLLSEETDPRVSDTLSLRCTNAVFPIMKGTPAIVRDEINLELTSTSSRSKGIDAMIFGGSAGKEGLKLSFDNSLPYVDLPPNKGQKTPIVYKVHVNGVKVAVTKVVSLATWIPGLIITSKLARKLVLPKQPKKGSNKIDLESSLVLPGSGRFELVIFTRSDIKILTITGVVDDALDLAGDGPKELRAYTSREGDQVIEVEIDSKYQIDIKFIAGDDTGQQILRTHLTCEETREEGCKSEFELLIKRNRAHLEKFNSKLVVQLDRHARVSTLQSWLLDEETIQRSFLPMVISADYHQAWTSPDWLGEYGPIFSVANFIHDPRPASVAFSPPSAFLIARAQLAKRIRESTDDQFGLLESAPIGKWYVEDTTFSELIESYLDAYNDWLRDDYDTACWVDVLAVCSCSDDGRTLLSVPEAIILNPLHPLRLAWHCLAQKVLWDEVEGIDSKPCPAASILDPRTVPDIMRLPIQSPNRENGIVNTEFLSVETNSDYWSVLWNGDSLSSLSSKARVSPFDQNFGLLIGGIANGFSPAQVGRALSDVAQLLSAKPILGVAISSAGGGTEACNVGLTAWGADRYGTDGDILNAQLVGQNVLEIYDTRPAESRPDTATIANLSENTKNRVRWFERQPVGAIPDLGIIAQLDSTQPVAANAGLSSPLGIGGLIRRRVRRQLNDSFLMESRQALAMPPAEHVFADKISTCIFALESRGQQKTGMQFAPNVYAVSEMLHANNAGFVAVSSSAIDPACFMSDWIEGTYLWDYDLPAYSGTAGDTNGYYLLSKIKEADCEALAKVLKLLPNSENITDDYITKFLLEVARRGIPTVRGLSGDDTGATGNLGLFLAARLLQDEFRTKSEYSSILRILSGTDDDATIALVIPVDPFRGYLADLAKSLDREKKDGLLSRPDLLVVGVRIKNNDVQIHLTPVEVKCRLGVVFGASESKEALDQAKALSDLFGAIALQAETSTMWRLAYQHLMVSMIEFGLRVYSKSAARFSQSLRWAQYQEKIVGTLLSIDASKVSVDKRGRLIVIDKSENSGPRDHDGDSVYETIVISIKDARTIATEDPTIFYESVKSKVNDWGFFPEVGTEKDPKTNIISGMPAGDKLPGNDRTKLYPIEIVVGAPIKPPLSSPKQSGIALEVGEAVDGFEPRQLSLNISDTKLNQLNMGVVGDLGTGKTQFLKSLIFQISKGQENNRGIKPRILIFDYKRDYGNKDAEFVAATGAKIVSPYRIALNLFSTSTLEVSGPPWLARYRFFADVLDKIYRGIGPVQRNTLKLAIQLAYEECDPSNEPTIYDIHAQYSKALDGGVDAIFSIIDDLVVSELFESDSNKTLSFDQFFSGVVVISLGELGQDDRTKNMLVAIMLNMFYENMLQTPKRGFTGTDPQLRVIDSYLLVDEASNIMKYDFAVLQSILLQGREFGAGVILASQYLTHFKTANTDYREALLTWFIHKVPNVSAPQLSALGFTSELVSLVETIKQFPNHHCLYKTHDVPGNVVNGLPFFKIQG